MKDNDRGNMNSGRAGRVLKGEPTREGEDAVGGGKASPQALREG